MPKGTVVVSLYFMPPSFQHTFCIFETGLAVWLWLVQNRFCRWHQPPTQRSTYLCLQCQDSKHVLACLAFKQFLNMFYPQILQDPSLRLVFFAWKTSFPFALQTSSLRHTVEVLSKVKVGEGVLPLSSLQVTFLPPFANDGYPPPPRESLRRYDFQKTLICLVCEEQDTRSCPDHVK